MELKKQYHQSNKKLKQVKFNDTKSTVYFNTDKHNEVLSLINTPPCNKDEKVFTQKNAWKIKLFDEQNGRFLLSQNR